MPPHGGAYEVPVHPAYVTSLRFAGKIASANTSAAMDKDYEIRADGPDGLLVRPKARSPGDANINIQVGPSRISALLRTLRDPKEACALVTFKATTSDELLIGGSCYIEQDETAQQVFLKEAGMGPKSAGAAGVGWNCLYGNQSTVGTAMVRAQALCLRP